ncbi:unnamed protein product [Discosporangium mesarthrocarpum]
MPAHRCCWPARGERPSDFRHSLRPSWVNRPWVRNLRISGRLGVRCTLEKTLWGSRRREMALHEASWARTSARSRASLSTRSSDLACVWQDSDPGQGGRSLGVIACSLL